MGSNRLVPAPRSERVGGILMGNLDGRSNDFGGPLRFLHERHFWSGLERRHLGSADVIGWGKTHREFAQEMDELIRSHPPPDPRKHVPGRP